MLSMFRTFRGRVTLIALFGLILGIPLPAEAQLPIRIGSSLSLSGKEYALQGAYCREGYLLCQKHVTCKQACSGAKSNL